MVITRNLRKQSNHTFAAGAQLLHLLQAQYITQTLVFNLQIDPCDNLVS